MSFLLLEASTTRTVQSAIVVSDSQAQSHIIWSGATDTQLGQSQSTNSRNDKHLVALSHQVLQWFVMQQK